MAYPNVVKKGWPDNLIAAIWPRYHLYDIDTRAVLDAVKALPENRGQIIKLRYENMLPLREIADIRHISMTRAAQLDKGAIAKLRSRLEKSGAAVLKPANRRENMISADSLEGYAYRYGHTTADKDIRFKDIIGKASGDTCPCCKEPFDPNGHPYGGLFVTGPREKTVKIICMRCAYAISPFVIEPGNVKRKGIGRKNAVGPRKKK